MCITIIFFWPYILRCKRPNVYLQKCIVRVEVLNCTTALSEAVKLMLIYIVNIYAVNLFIPVS